MRGRGASSCPRHCNARGPGTGSAAGSEGRTRRWRPAESHREGSSPPAPPGPGPSAKESPARLRPAPGRGSRGAGPGEGSGCQSAASLRSVWRFLALSRRWPGAGSRGCRRGRWAGGSRWRWARCWAGCSWSPTWLRSEAPRPATSCSSTSCRSATGLADWSSWASPATSSDTRRMPPMMRFCFP